MGHSIFWLFYILLQDVVEFTLFAEKLKNHHQHFRLGHILRLEHILCVSVTCAHVCIGLLLEVYRGYWVSHLTILCFIFLGWEGLPLNLEISFRGLPISAQSARVTGAHGHAQLWKVDAEDWTQVLMFGQPALLLLETALQPESLLLFLF